MARWVSTPVGIAGLIVFIPFAVLATFVSFKNGEIGTAVGWLVFLVLLVLAAVHLYRRPKEPEAPEPTQVETPALGSASKTESAVGCFIVVMLFLAGLTWGSSHLAVWLFPGSTWAHQFRNQFDRELKGAVIHIEPKPHDCEFLTAPIGLKHCDYDPRVTTVRINNTPSESLVSYDEGKTWQSAGPSDKRMVLVTWQRVEN
jgi:hypothetical protein